MKRVFVFTSSKCFGYCGGGSGIVYRLYEANRQYGLFDNVYWIFEDRIVHSKDPVGKIACKSGSVYRDCRNEILKALPGEFRGALGAIRIRNLKAILKRNLQHLDKLYRFNNDDIFMFHEIVYLDAFCSLYDFKNTLVVDHSQGGYYNEWSASSGRNSTILHKFIIHQYIRILKKTAVFCFPSQGAKESLTDVEPILKDYINKTHVEYLLSGIKCPDLYPTNLDHIKEFSQTVDYVFVTVANLNAAKAVERIPAFLQKLTHKGFSIGWILIGNGINETIVSDAITECLDSNNVIWIKDYVEHNYVLNILSISDFYITLHKQSVFDLSILEAMYYGCIPILSYVGGNKDILDREIGIKILAEDDTNPVEEVLNSHRLFKEKKCNSIQVMNTEFSDVAFLQRYKTVCDELFKSSGARE